MTVPGRYWQKLNDGRIQCEICPRLCKLNSGQRGLCFVRQALNNQISLTTYGRSSGFCIDVAFANAFNTAVSMQNRTLGNNDINAFSHVPLSANHFAN